MKRKVLWCCLSLLLVAALVLAACGPKEEVVKKGELYGGTLTVLHKWTKLDPEGWDTTAGFGWQTSFWTHPFLEHLLTGGIEELGPRGKNISTYRLAESVPEEYLVGQLAESWEVTTDPLGVIYHIRKGVMFTGNPKIGMEPREVTADDVAYCLEVAREAAAFSTIAAFVKSITATDRYTVVIEFNKYDAAWSFWIGSGWGAEIYPPEVREAGVADWRNQVGTGPFILTDYVPGSVATYKRNPNYWDTTTINGKEYQLPFVDELIYPIMPEESTQIAAIRTGKVDFNTFVPYIYKDELSQTSPELIQEEWLGGGTYWLLLNCRTSEYFTNRNIRRAMMISLDLDTMVESLWGKGEKHSFPIWPDHPLFIPLKDLPAETQLLFSYQPDLARQMLADEGYPDGFEVEFTICSKMYPTDPDLATLVTKYWGDIGVEVKVDARDQAAFLATYASYENYKDSTTGLHGSTNPVIVFGYGVSDIPPGVWDDESFAEQYQEVLVTVDTAERNAKIQDLAYYWLDSAAVIPIGNSYVSASYWPWVKNYYGEVETGFLNQIPIIARIWLDQELKAEMGY